jgi:hypothetical protein
LAKTREASQTVNPNVFISLVDQRGEERRGEERRGEERRGEERREKRKEGERRETIILFDTFYYHWALFNRYLFIYCMKNKRLLEFFLFCFVTSVPVIMYLVRH